jgi:ribosomal protein L6P/L9E
MYLFGTGTLTVTPRNGEESMFGTVQEVGVDISYGAKELYGEHQFPVDIARTQGKISIKAKAAKIDAKLFNDVFFHGDVVTASGTTTVTVTNKLMGSAPVFTLKLDVVYDGHKMTLTFPRCISNKLGLAFKSEDHLIPDFDIVAYADEDGRLYTVKMVE